VQHKGQMPAGWIKTL